MTKSDPKVDVLAAVAAAYASRSDVSADDIVAFVGKLHAQFGAHELTASPSESPVHASDRAQPAIPIDKAVTHDKVYCLCCGKGFKMLKRHLGAEHNLTEAAYRAMFRLPEDMPLVAPSYSDRKAKYARKVGFGKYDRGDSSSGHSPSEENHSIS